MKRLVFISLLLCSSLLFADEMVAEHSHEEVAQLNAADCACDVEKTNTCGCDTQEKVLSPYYDMRINVSGQGVAPVNTASPAQAYALAKRAAIADAYRLIAEKIKGVRVEGEDTVKNMMVKRSTIRTYVDAMIRNANVVETTFEEGLCEVEMEIILSYSQFAH